MVDEKGLSPEVADRIGTIVQWRGGTTTGPLTFDTTNEVRTATFCFAEKRNRAARGPTGLACSAARERKIATGTKTKTEKKKANENEKESTK